MPAHSRSSKQCSPNKEVQGWQSWVWLCDELFTADTHSIDQCRFHGVLCLDYHPEEYMHALVNAYVMKPSSPAHAGPH